MRMLLHFVGMPVLRNHHCLSFSTGTLEKFGSKDVPDCFSCISGCNHQKCRRTIFLVIGLDPLMSSTTHLSKSCIFNFPFGLVVILHALIYELFDKQFFFVKTLQAVAGRSTAYI